MQGNRHEQPENDDGGKGKQKGSEHLQSPLANEQRFRRGHSEWQFESALFPRREFLSSESALNE